LGKSGKAALAVVEMTGPDTRMDQFGNLDAPANPLPVKCLHCTMPDLDAVARPYLLAKGFAAPAEHAPAEVGNFLVRERTRKTLELVVPGQCTFVATAEKKSKKPTPWSLAVPMRIVDMPGLELHDSKGGRCNKCGEPKLGYLGRKNAIAVKQADYAGADVFKTRQWYAQRTEEDSLASVNRHRKSAASPLLDWSAYGITAPPHPQRWTRAGLSRDLFFSVRLEQLLKKAKLKGQLVRYTGFDDVKPNSEDLAWIDEKLQLLAEHGLVDGKNPAAAKKGTSGGANKWFTTYLKKNAAKKKPAAVDFAAIEKKQKLTLPQDYKAFISTVGPKTFENVMEQEGFTATILPPAKIDFRTFRRGKMKDLVFEEASLAVDGVMFAASEHGDAFVFDVAQRNAAGTCPVYWYDHEGNTLEPFAPTFADAIKRFATST
jgi:hypothetical protein